MKAVVSSLILFWAFSSFAQQKETFDLATYTVPSGWTKSGDNKNVISYSTTNNQKGTYCQIGIYSSTTSKGDLQADFESEWQTLIVKTYKPSSKPQVAASTSESGWSQQAGLAPFEFNSAQSAAMLVTWSGYNRCMSVVVVTNTQDYQTEIETFLASVAMKKMETPEQPIGKSPSNTGFAFNTTNFDDGWISSVQADWVNVVKGETSVILHYPTKRIDLSSADYATIGQNSWNTLIAPRYRGMENYFQSRGTVDYQRPYIIAADLIDNLTGKKSYVVLFKMGDSGWIEIITANKASFVQLYGVDINTLDYYADSKIWDPLLKMAGYNRFAVGASDLKGKWTDKFSGFTQYVNMYTGTDAGMNTHSSSEVFEFTGDSYKWELKVASGMVGNIKFQSAKSAGTFSMSSNWQAKFSDIDGKPKTYNVYFSCLKGARILWMEDSVYANGYEGFGKSE